MSTTVAVRRIPRARAAGRALLTLAMASLVGCGSGAESPGPERERTTDAALPERPPARIFEQGFAFLGSAGDSVLMVPWLMRTTATPDSTVREARGWLSRANAWEAFYAERWSTPPTRVPGRLLPHGSLSIVVRDGDLVDGLVFSDGPRNLEIAMGQVLAAWVGPGGETLDLMEGAAYLSDQRIDGLVVDVSRAWREDAPPAGDWLFVTSGDSLRLLMVADIEHGLAREPVYRGWVQHGQQDAVWPEMRVQWTMRQAFPPARRDVPTGWSFWSDDRRVSGTLHGRTSEIEAGEGPGPLLPVRALIDLEGTIIADGRRFDVRGLLVHQRR